MEPEDSGKMSADTFLDSQCGVIGKFVLCKEA